MYSACIVCVCILVFYHFEVKYEHLYILLDEPIFCIYLSVNTGDSNSGSNCGDNASNNKNNNSGSLL